MLEELDVKNFALIDSAHIEFSKGFTVLSGETGAGKSILIGSLAFLLGGKAGMEQIRTGCREAQVSGTFLLDCKEAKDWLGEHGIEDEDGRILLRRVVRATGKSSAWIGGVSVTRADLSAFAAFLVDLHGQHEQQSLMKVPEHRRYLDSYAGIEEEVRAFTALYNALCEKRRALEDFASDEEWRRNRIDMLGFAVDEIDAARLKEGEDEELEAEEARLSSFEKLYSDMEEIRSLLDGGGEGVGVMAVLRKMNGIATHALEMDRGLENLQGRLQASFYELDDIADEFHRYADSLVFDPDRLAAVQERLELIYKLKKKYTSGPATSVADVLSYAEKARQQLEELSGLDSDKSALEAAVSALEKQVYEAAKTLSARRKAAAETMSGAVEGILAHLGMKAAVFRVSIVEKPGTTVSQRCDSHGMDNIQFLISANPGSPLLPLAQIASGGELSRVMLALKTILCGADTAGTLIFDEIDTGIGGEIAVGIGEHLKKLSKKKQVLCITHLASIAVYADNQVKIEKGVADNTTSTNVFPISGQARVKEIARMLSGDASSLESLEHAAAMLHKFGGT